MTAQATETLIWKGEAHAMRSEPLEAYFQKVGVKPALEFTSSALWRGYRGTWVIDKDWLYLVAVEGKLEGWTGLTLDALFPAVSGSVLADWFTGQIKLATGDMLEYVHLGWGSVYSEETILTIKCGHLEDVEVIQYLPPPDVPHHNVPEGNFMSRFRSKRPR